MKKMLILLFLLNILSSYTQTNPLQNKYSNAERVYIAYSMNEKILKCIESKFTDLRDKTLKSNLWLEKHFGKSKVNSGNFIKENSTVNLKDYENDSFRDCDSLDKKTSIFLLEHFEEIVSKTLIEENALGFNYQDNPILEFFDGYTQSFDTKGHQKAKNSDWSVKIPKSWVATETKNINIIQCFQNDYGTGDATIYLTVNDIPSDIEKDFNYEQAFKDRNEKLKKNQGSTTSTPISNKLMTIALLKGHLSIYVQNLKD